MLLARPHSPTTNQPKIAKTKKTLAVSNKLIRFQILSFIAEHLSAIGRWFGGYSLKFIRLLADADRIGTYRSIDQQIYIPHQLRVHMLKNWFLITAASFGVGFGVTYTITQLPTPSAIAGAAGTTGAIGSVILCSKQRKEEVERKTRSMQATVNILEQQEKALGQQMQSHQDNRQTIQYQVGQLEQQLAGLQSKQQGQEASISKFDRELETKRNSVAELDAKRAELTTLTAEIANLQHQQKAAQAALLNLQNIEAEITIYSVTKAQLTLEVAQLEKYQTEIKIQIADDKDICEKAEEYLLFVDQEVRDKQSDSLELDINIKHKVAELNTCRQQLAELSQQKTEAESAIKKLAIELQQAGEAILQQENVQQAAESQLAQLTSDIAALKLELLDCHSQMTDPSLQYVDVPQPDYLSAEELQSFPDLVEPSLDLLEASLPELAKPADQFVEFQPVAFSMFDLEETSPISASSFSDLCEMDLIEISADSLELGLLDITDLDDMTLDQNSLDILNTGALDLSDITLDQEPMATKADFDWSENFIGNPYTAVLWHIDQHGSIEHFEVATLLNDKKLAKQFAANLPEYAELLPFAIDIEVTKTGNRYQKRALVLIEA